MQVETVVVSGSFDDLRAAQVRLLEEAARLGPLQVLLWSDEAVRRLQGKGAKFPQAERAYLVEAIRYVDRLTICSDPFEPDALPLQPATRPATWVVDQSGHTAGKEEYCRRHRLGYRVFSHQDLAGFPEDQPPAAESPGERKRVIVSGCYDWFHSGHVRFFEEVSALGDLYVVVGHDANIRLLKGQGHPLFPQQERRYLVQAVRYVKQALVSTGHGWLDAQPEIERVRPHIYAVNEDGDRPEKREYCQAQGIEYRVLKRLPKEGLPRRVSTDLRGF
jgi:cytidyltransferase-like protein